MKQPITPSLAPPKREFDHGATCDLWPRHSVGIVSPAPDGPFIYYQFYQAMPRNIILVASSINLGGFAAEHVDRALESFWSAFEVLLHQGVQRVSLVGLPLCAFAGRPRILSLLDEARRKTDVTVSTDFEDCLDAFRLMGIRRVATAAKWPAPLMRAVRDYLEHAGFEVVAEHGEPHTLDQVLALRAGESVDVAVRIGVKALQENPEAEGLLLGGGGWLVMQAVEEIERRTGKPVVSNSAAIYWGALRQFGLRCAVDGTGRLMDSLTT